MKVVVLGKLGSLFGLHSGKTAQGDQNVCPSKNDEHEKDRIHVVDDPCRQAGTDHYGPLLPGRPLGWGKEALPNGCRQEKNRHDSAGGLSAGRAHVRS